MSGLASAAFRVKMQGNSVQEEVHVAESDVKSLLPKVAEDDESTLICDLSDVAYKYRNWLKQMPRIKPHYAIKANSHLPMLKVLVKLGAGFDCASKGEIETIISLGVSPKRIIFANPVKVPSHIRYAKSKGVDLMTFDSDAELYKIRDIFPEANLVLRVRFDSPSAKVSFGEKFGCEPAHAYDLLSKARELGFQVTGLSFHAGTEIKDPVIYKNALRSCREIFDQARTLGYNFTLVDVGGGFHGAKGTSIEKAAHVLNKAVEEFFPDPAVKVISEPGRYFASSAFTLVSKLICKRLKQSPNLNEDEHEDHYKRMYYINDSIYKNFNCVVSERKKFWPTLPKVPINFEHPRKFLSIIWGQTCHSSDCILRDQYLPELKLGEYLIWENMGAYTLSISSTFNGFSHSNVYNIINSDDR